MDKYISKPKIINFLGSAASIIIFWSVVILLFKSCAALFEPSEDEGHTEKFLTNLESDKELRRGVLDHCKLKEEVEFPVNSDVSVSCLKTSNVIYSAFFTESTYNRETNELIENAKSDWIIKLASYSVTSDSDIEFFLTSLSKNVHYCVATLKMTREERERARYAQSCIGVMPICLDAAYKDEWSEDLIFCGSYMNAIMSTRFNF